MKRKFCSVEKEWLDEAGSGLLSGRVSAIGLQRLVKKAQAAGARGAELLEKAGKHGDLPGNINRDMSRSLRRFSQWPKFYYATIPVWDALKEEIVQASHPFLLPHEWLAKAGESSVLDFLKGSFKQDTGIYAHMKEVADGLGSPLDHIPLGLHFDGVPFGSQVFYSDSLEVFSINFPCSDYTVRIPFTSIQKKHLVKHETFNAVLAVLAWSLKCLAFGVFPKGRHDGASWQAGEQQFRRRFYSEHQPAKALLVEIRADWVALKQVFQFPQQNENKGICWMCHATPSDVRDCKVQASWKEKRRTAFAFHSELKHAGKSCPLWSVPGVSCKIVMVDWLHCCDLGVTADVLGNVLLELLNAMGDEESRDTRMKTLWLDILATYRSRDVGVDMRFPHMKVKSFLQPGKSPKLRGKASHIRGLVSILDALAGKYLQHTDVHTQTVKSCLAYLAKCYKELGNFSAERFEDSANRMAILYCALEKEQLHMGIEKRWKVKPKLHLFLELAFHVCKERGNPKKFWTYADETHGGYLREIAKSRGGRNSSSSSCYRMLTRFVCSCPLPEQTA